MKLRPTYWPAVLALLPVVLLHSSIRNFQEVEQMKTVFLRNRSAAVAAKLETVSSSSREQIQALLEEEPGVLEVQVIPEPGDPKLADLWNGRELFRTEMLEEDSRQIYRSLIPFHDGGQLRIARIDIDAGSADFLLDHARHNVIIATVSGAVIVLLTIFALWSIRRSAREEHLAHLGKLSAVLAHEIRTPLATIKGFTQLAIEKADRNVQPILEPVVTETQRLERLVNDLLLYGRPPKPVIADCCWEDIAEALRSDGVSVDLTPVRFRTDPDLLRHVLSNLVRNATEALAATPGGWVRVSTRVSGGELVITVDDNGPGIPPAQREKVFESFFTTKSFGTGLGLPIARSLTAALGGNLVVMPGEGGGTRAEVRLPSAGAHVRATEVKT